MKRVFALIRWLWWALVAGLPIATWKIERVQMDLIGCPPRGDCYVPGSEALHYWDALIIGMAALLWPDFETRGPL
jgi:hypothetical protein